LGIAPHLHEVCSTVDLSSATVVPYSGGTPAIINEMMGKRVGLVFEAY
jgi:hypothetical protein